MEETLLNFWTYNAKFTPTVLSQVTHSDFSGFSVSFYTNRPDEDPQMWQNIFKILGDLGDLKPSQMYNKISILHS